VQSRLVLAVTPIELRIERFGSVIAPQTFTFPDKPGLYFLSGKNGSGKSTVWAALTWCLYGKNAKGLRAGDVANWTDPKGASVSFLFEHGHEVHVVTRQHSPNLWAMSDTLGNRIDLTNDETNPMLAMLRLDYEMWLSAVVIAQDEPMFLDLKPDAKSNLFATVMRLDKWDDYSARAGKLAADSTWQLNALKAETAKLQGRIEEMDRNLDKLPELIGKWERHQSDRKALIAEQYEDVFKQLPKLKEAHEHAAIKHTDALAALRAAHLRIEPAQKTSDAVFDAKASQQTRVALVTQEAARLEKVIASLESGTCPTCGDTGGRVMSAVNVSKMMLDEALQAEQKESELLKDRERDCSSARAILVDVQDRAKNARTACDMADHSLKAARIAVEAANRSLDLLEKEADELSKERCPYSSSDATRDRNKVHSELMQLLDKVSDAQDRSELLGYWVKGFKELRLTLIAEALDQLAIEVASAVEAIGLRGWSLTFEVDRETKKGTLARGFNVFVKSPANDRQVPWESWSGGEAQRLRVATQWGLINLIRQSTGADIAMEVFDEPTHGMEAQGIVDMLDVLRDRAQSEQRQIWVVDHHALGSAAFDGTVLVEKTRKGTTYGAVT
jgi:DNA repair exonuclease SbcCD ATPase subunit